MLACAGLPALAAEIDPEADRVLRQMSEYLAGLEAFSVTTDTTTDVLLANGQKIEIHAAGTGVFDRRLGFGFWRKGAEAAMELSSTAGT